MIFFDLTDLVRYASFTTQVTGIQRVVLEAVRGLGESQTSFFISPTTGAPYIVGGLPLASTEDLRPFRELELRADLLSGSMPRPAMFRAHALRWLKSRKRATRMLGRILLACLRWPFLREVAMRVARQKVKADLKNTLPLSIEPFRPTAGDVVAIFGGVWNQPDHYKDFVKSLPAGVDRAFLIHDLIPLMSPFVPDILREMFKDFIPFVLQNATQIICYAQSNARDLRRFAAGKCMRVPPIALTQLAHRLPRGQRNTPDLELPFRTRRLMGETYVLCAGSIEARKNQINALTLWARFVSSPEYRNQKFVLAGRYLWEFSAVQNFLYETGHCFGSVIVVEEPSDDELSFLYENCRFSIFISHYEGWGLPVGESLSFGKPCLTFDNSALVEAGAGLSTVVPTYDYEALYKHFWQLMCDDAVYARQRRIVQEGQDKLRTWSDFAHDVRNIILRSDII